MPASRAEGHAALATQLPSPALCACLLLSVGEARRGPAARREDPRVLEEQIDRPLRRQRVRQTGEAGGYLSQQIIDAIRFTLATPQTQSLAPEQNRLLRECHAEARLHLRADVTGKGLD
jgi:hypothetical protein